MASGNIRNFCILAHIDHGKSTLADRFLEITGTVPKNKLKPQHLDQLESERERGITIKMAPVRMSYTLTPHTYTLNLIDTPGHSDFSYEVSRALQAVEGVILLVDATQGIQAQTLANFESAKKANLVIIGAIGKVDIASPEQIDETKKELSQLLDIDLGEIVLVSGKTGEGTKELLQAVITEIPPPSSAESASGDLLIFDSHYDEHKGIIVHVRVLDGSFSPGPKIKEVGHFAPQLTPKDKLVAGEIGYIVSGEKDPRAVKVGGEGIDRPLPVVFVSFYPETSNQYEELKKALGRLQLNDAALTFEPEKNGALGRGFKIGFLGRLHFEITAERLEKEFKVRTVHSFPSVAYRFEGNEILEPVAKVEIITPPQYLGAALALKEIFRLSIVETKNLGGRLVISAKLPLADLISDFDDKLKSSSSGYASFNYEIIGYEKGDLEKMEIMVAGQLVPGLGRILPKEKIYREARQMVERLAGLLPRKPFAQAIQASARGKIIARETIAALRKDVTGYLYGGDRSRKMKLWKKQQKGKARLKAMAEAEPIKIPAEIFKELLKR